MSMPEFTPEFKTREDGLVAVEQCAREILEQLSEERLEQIKTDTGRKFAQQIRDRAEAASHATEWDNEQAAGGHSPRKRDRHTTPSELVSKREPERPGKKSTGSGCPTTGSAAFRTVSIAQSLAPSSASTRKIRSSAKPGV